jgi:hypothetical protein
MGLSLRAAADARAKRIKDGQAEIDAANEAAEEAVENKEVVFYSWIDGGNQSQPSSITIRIGGGERIKDPDSGRIVVMGYHEVRFNMGILRTGDAEAIRVIRGMIKKGETITEDKEIYLAKVEKPELRAARLSRRHAEDANTVKQQQREIDELKAKLAATGAPA